MGFTLDPAKATAWIQADPKNANVLFPFLNGEDINSRPDLSAPRWVIDFNDRSEAEAQTYRLPYRAGTHDGKTAAGNRGSGQWRTETVVAI